MNILYLITGLTVLLFFVGKINLAIRFRRQVRNLFSKSALIATKCFSRAQLTGLPDPVRKYFELTLKEGQPYISYVSLRHDGLFRPGIKKPWVSIRGVEYFTTKNPGYVWKGRTSLFTARDMYLGNKGRLIVSLLSFLPIVNAKGAKYDQGELLRWLAESVWFPTNLLPSHRLTWLPMDEQTAGLVFNFRGIRLSLIVRFNLSGEIREIESTRYMDAGKEEIWICRMTDYQFREGMRIPISTEALWRLPEGDISYARFNLKQIIYNKPWSL